MVGDAGLRRFGRVYYVTRQYCSYVFEAAPLAWVWLALRSSRDTNTIRTGSVIQRFCSYTCVGGAYDMKVQLTPVFYEYVWVESVTSRYGSLVCSLRLYGIRLGRVVRWDTRQ